MAEPLKQPTDYHRHCPGEEQVRISDPVCLGRRRANYHKCPGCPFNDDEAVGDGLPADRTAREEKERRDRIESVFKAYDVRSLCPDPLDGEIAWRIGHATAQFLRSELRGYDRARPEKTAVAVGRDMRKSSPALAEGLIEGLRVGGARVIDLGMIDTPQLYFAVNHLSCAGGVQVTASHNPAPYNGFKICGQKARPVGRDTGLTKICKIAKNTVRHETPQRASLERTDLAEPYRRFVRDFLAPGGGGYNGDRPLRLIVDASNGMAGRWIPLLFEGIEWLEVIRLNFEHNGEFAHDPNPLVEANLRQLQDRMARSKGDLGVCFDGDADRCVFVDTGGRIVSADLMTALLARHLLQDAPGSSVVYDLRSSRVVPEEIRKAGGVPRRERCGHAFLKKSMADAKGVFGGELSGHYYFRDNWSCDSGMIALATVVNVLTATGQGLHDLIAPLRRYAHSGERNFRNEKMDETIRQLAGKYAGAKLDFLDGISVEYKDWWFNVRPSNTEPYLRLNVEAADETALATRLAELCPLLGTPVDE